MEWAEIWDLLTKLVNPQSIIHYGGLWLLVFVIFAETGLLVGFFLPGDSLLFTAGLLSADPKFGGTERIFDLHIANLLIFVTVAAILGDSLGYYIGKRGGPKVFNRPKSWFFKPEYVTTTSKFYQKHGDKTLIIGRFLPIVRTFAPVLAGVVALEYRRFVSYNVIGGVLWVFSLTLMGYFLGSSFPWIREYYEYFVIGFVLVTTVPIVRMIIKESKARKAQNKTDEELAEEAQHDVEEFIWEHEHPGEHYEDARTDERKHPEKSRADAE